MQISKSLLIAVAFLSLSAPAFASVPPGASWKPTFADEFDGSSIDPARWGKRYKWGEAVINNELQAYVDDAFELANGMLHIVGKHESGDYAGQTLDYRSGVISSVHHQKYGYFEASMKMPGGKGLWPAFWLLGENGTTGVNEIDIHEFLGHQPTIVHMTVHWGDSYQVNHQSDGDSFDGPDFTAGFHTFGLEWDAGKVVWYVDDVERFRHEGVGVPQVEMYLIANLAIGGSWPGSPDSTTQFPAYYDIDYIRAYEKDDSDSGTGTETGMGGAAGAAGQGGSAGTAAQAGSAGGPGMGGAAGAAGNAGAAGKGGAGGVAVDSGAGGAQTDAGSPASSPDSDGCGCRTAGSSSAAASWILALAGLVTAARRRRSGNGTSRPR
ncbi:MAG: glycoside hydrolase family 16 protein [Deltaproteobacteria bacterium]|nr:glycoside hydrolase family 16 protein [Deltaproteobacteria bacterium]